MAYPNTTSQSLHTLKINKVPDADTFEKMQEDHLVNANELYLVEGDGGSGGILWVTLTEDQNEDIIANYTFTEVDTAIQAGNTVVVELENNRILYLEEYYEDPTHHPMGYCFSDVKIDSLNSSIYRTTAIVDRTRGWLVLPPINLSIPENTSDLTNDSGFTSNTGTITGVSINGTSVATSGVANITSIPASILSGAIPSAVTATTQDSSDNSTKIATTAFVKTAISGLIGPMMFKGTLGTGGTITTLPTAAEANTGFTYKVITDGTYASIAAKVGDLFISNGSEWIIVPSGDETFVPTLTSTSDGQGHVTLGVTVGPMVNGNTMSF